MSEELLRRRERHEQRRVRGSRTLEADDVTDACLVRYAGGVDDNFRTGLDPELGSGLAVEVDLAAREIGQREIVSVRADDRREAVHMRRIRGEQDDARLALAHCRRLHRDLIDDRTRDAVGEPRAGERGVDPLDRGLGNPAGARRGSEGAGDVVDRPSWRDRLVRRPERVDRGRAHRVVHRVAGHQRGSDDRRAKHQTDHDEGAAATPTSDVTDGELEENAVPKREEGDEPESHGQRDYQDHHQRVDGDAEELMHRLLLLLVSTLLFSPQTAAS